MLLSICTLCCTGINGCFGVCTKHVSLSLSVVLCIVPSGNVNLQACRHSEEGAAAVATAAAHAVTGPSSPESLRTATSSRRSALWRPRLRVWLQQHQGGLPESLLVAWQIPHRGGAPDQLVSRRRLIPCPCSTVAMLLVIITLDSRLVPVRGSLL